MPVAYKVVRVYKDRDNTILRSIRVVPPRVTYKLGERTKAPQGTRLFVYQLACYAKSIARMLGNCAIYRCEVEDCTPQFVCAERAGSIHDVLTFWRDYEKFLREQPMRLPDGFAETETGTMSCAAITLLDKVW